MIIGTVPSRFWTPLSVSHVLIDLMQNARVTSGGQTCKGEMDEGGRTPKDWAEERNQHSTVELLNDITMPPTE